MGALIRTWLCWATKEIDGYDDFVKKVLSPQGLALTLGGPGKSWRRQGAKVLEFPVQNEILEKIRARSKLLDCFA